MPRRHSIAEARMKLPRLIREAETGKVVELTRRGERVAFLIGRKQYERLVSRKRRFSEVWDEFRHAIDVPELDIDPDETFGGLRDAVPGRDTGL